MAGGSEKRQASINCLATKLYKFCQLIEASLGMLCFITFAHMTSLLILRLGMGMGVGARGLLTPRQNDYLDHKIALVYVLCKTQLFLRYYP